MAVAVHWFDESGDAYDASQYRDDIKDGDVLVVENDYEKSVAILFHAWPVAIWPQGYVTDKDNPFRFHAPREGMSLERIVEYHMEDGDPPDKYDASLQVAMDEVERITRKLGSPS
jgi:hypothetical protein